MKIKLNLSAKKIFKYSMVAVFLLAVCLTAYTAVYLYKNFYLVVTQSQDIVLSNEKMSIETINIKKFDSVIKNIENKTNPAPYSYIKDIFR